jgi:ribonuclease P protein component
LQAAVSVSSKNFKKAVDRNRIKRLMREPYRLQKSSLQNKLAETGKHLAVFFIYTGAEIPVYASIAEKMETILSQLENIV